LIRALFARFDFRWLPFQMPLPDIALSPLATRVLLRYCFRFRLIAFAEFFDALPLR